MITYMDASETFAFLWGPELCSLYALVPKILRIA